MTEETQDRSFERLLAAKKAMAAYRLPENLEDEQGFTKASSNSAPWSTNLTVVDPSNFHLGAVRGAGKSFIVNYTTAAVQPFKIAPATIITSGAVETLFTIGQGGSMATQHPSVVDEPTVEEIIRRARTTLPLRYRERVASRLSELEKTVQEEELDGRGITVKSVHHFVEFLKAYPALRCPAVSVTPDRNLYASWKLGYDRVFSIHFLPEGEVRFVIFHPNEKHPAQAIRLSGTATADVIMNVAAPQGVLDWAAE